jgi:hypothetical protein
MVSGSNFCIDKQEANQDMTFAQADAYCKAKNQRLCTTAEYMFSCSNLANVIQWNTQGATEEWQSNDGNTPTCASNQQARVNSIASCPPASQKQTYNCTEATRSISVRCCSDLVGGVSNVPATMIFKGTNSLNATQALTFNTDTGEIQGLRAAGTGLISGIYFDKIPQANGTNLGVFVFTQITIAANVTVTGSGNSALVLLSSSTCDISGTINVSGANSPDVTSSSSTSPAGTGRCGGSNGGTGSNLDYQGATSGFGSGAGSVGTPGVHYGNGGGGGGFGAGGGGGYGGTGIAGQNGTDTAGGAPGNDSYGKSGGGGGNPYGSPVCAPLYGGSGGGGGLSDADRNPDGSGSGGGGGGGAVQISCLGKLTIVSSGTINASGGNAGTAYGGGGGGGSGGSIFLEAPEVTNAGKLLAHGGIGGHGNLRWVPSGRTGGARGGLDLPRGGGGGTAESGGGGGGCGRIRIHTSSSGNFTNTGNVHPSTSPAFSSAKRP